MQDLPVHPLLPADPCFLHSAKANQVDDQKARKGLRDDSENFRQSGVRDNAVC